MKSKKFIILMLSMTLAVSLCGCKAEQGETKEDPVSAQSVSEAETEPTSTPEPTPTSTPKPTPTSTPEPTPDPKTTPEYHFTDAVKERGVLKVGVSNNSKMCYVIPDDPETYGELAGTRDGYVPALCRRIAEELGVGVEFVEYETLEEQLQAVTAGDVDLAADNFNITEERLAIYEMSVDFSVTEIEGDQVFLSTAPQPWLPPEEEAVSGSDPQPAAETPAEPEPREMIKSEEELNHARIAVVKGSVQATNTAKQYPEAELHELSGNQEVLEALSAGQVDAGIFTMMDNAFADQVVQAIIDGTVAQCEYTVAIPDFRGVGLIFMKGNQDFCQSVSGIISSLRESGWLLSCYDTEYAEAIERGI